MKKHKLFVIFQILLYSCSGTEDTGFTFTAESFDETYHLSNGKTYRNDSLFLGKPKYISFHPDSFLLFSDVGKNLIKIIDLKSNKIQEIIPQGRGPGELITAWGIETKGKDVYKYCVQLGKVVILTPGIDRKFQITDEYKLEEKRSLRFYPLKKDFAVCLSTIGDEKRLTFVNAKGKIIKKMGDYPPILNNTKVKGDNNIFQANMTGTPDGSMILIACSQTDVREIYNTEKGLMKRFQGPIGIQLSVKDTGVGKLLDPSYKTFSYSKANENEFWVSYVGYNFTAGKKPSSSDGTPKQIYCFDWNGKPLRILKFDSCFHGFDVDWDSKVMYLLEDGNEGTEIVSYSLIDILK